MKYRDLFFRARWLRVSVGGGGGGRGLWLRFGYSANLQVALFCRVGLVYSA